MNYQQRQSAKVITNYAILISVLIASLRYNKLFSFVAKTSAFFTNYTKIPKLAFSSLLTKCYHQ